MPTLNELPLEIIDRFIEELADLFDSGQKQARQNNLRSCSSTSRALHARARRLLFKDIAVVVKPGDVTSRSSESLHQLMDPRNDPHLATYVRSFSIEIATRGGQISPLCDQHVPDLLRWCGNIETLSLGALYGRCGWNQISKEIQEAFISLRVNPTLDTLRLSGFGLEVPIDIILHWNGLKRLTIRAAPIAHVAPTITLPPTAANLDTLDLITNFSTSLEFLVTNHPTILKSLQHLSATIYGINDWISIWKLLHDTRSTLQTLTVADLFTTTPLSEIAAALKPEFSFANLRYISILERHPDKMGSVVDIVVLLSSSPNLESIRVDLRWEIINEHRVSWLSSELEGMGRSWDKLDRTLALKPHMQELEFILRFVFPDSRTIHDWGSNLEGVRANWNPESILPLLAVKESVQTRMLWKTEIGDI